MHEVIAAIAPNDSIARFTGLGVRVIAGTARFRDPDTVTVGDAFEIKARRFVIATGSSPALPPIPGLENTPHLTNESVFDLTARPEHLIVIGAGPIGLELAQAFRRLGTQVTVLEAAQPLAREDPECAAILLDALAREHIEVRGGVTVVRIENAPPGVRVIVRTGSGVEEVIAGSHLLVATGRRVNVDDLGLDRAGIAYDRKGIQVDRRLRTTNRRVYAVGDVAGGLQFTHVANYHAGIVLRNVLFRLPATVSEDAVPARDLHRPGTRPGRTDRGRGPAARGAHPGAALALSRERPGAGRARNHRSYQGHNDRPGEYPGGDHRGRRGR